MLSETEQRILSSLSRKERRVTAELAKGQTNAEIAAVMNTTTQTVKNYLRSIYDKFGFSRRVEMAMFLITHPALLEMLGYDAAAPFSLPGESIFPALGTVLIYHPRVAEKADLNDGVPLVLAMVVAVTEDLSRPNLKLLLNGPRDAWRKSVPPRTAPDQECCWSWPRRSV